MSFRLWEDHLYAGYETYDGPAEECHIAFSIPWPDQLDWFFTSYYRNRLISAAKDSVEDEGGTILRTTIYRDKSPTWHTDYELVITAHGSPVHLPWLVIVGGVFILLAIVGVAYTVTVLDIDWGEVAPEISKGIQWTAIGLIGGGALALGGAVILRRKRHG